MRSEFLLRHRVSVASTVVVTVAVAALVLYALAVPGFTRHEADLDDGGVWITKNLTGQFGRLNKPINQLDGYGVAAGADGSNGTYDVDVFQDESSVVGFDLAKKDLYPIDVTSASTIPSKKVALTGSPQVAMGGGVLAVLDADKGAVRAIEFPRGVQLDDLGGLDTDKPLAVAGADAALAVAQDGTVLAVSVEKGLTTLRAGSTGFGRPLTTKIAIPAGTLSVSAIGGQAVVLSTPSGAGTASVVLPGGRTVQLPDGAQAVLQQPGPAADTVLVATPSAMWSIPLDGGDPKELFSDASGRPAPPLRKDGCIFGAWAGQPGTFAASCDDSKLVPAPLPGVTGDSLLVFRVNRAQILLNDRLSGKAYNIDDPKDPQQVANWEDVTPKPKPDKNTKAKNNQTDSTKPQPPQPKDDLDLGARPGRTTSLFVLDNDSNPSGDVLAVDSVDVKDPDVKRMLSISPDGQTVDLDAPSDLTGQLQFEYSVRTLKGLSRSAKVVVSMRQPSQNAAPALRPQRKEETWKVTQSGTVTIPALADWRDRADGDPVVLTTASVPKGSGTVATTPDGQLVYTAPDRAGVQTLKYDVTDGRDARSGTVKVNVLPGNGSPIAATARPDYARGQVGRPITIYPLANDLPGVDPRSPGALTELAGTLRSPSGAKVTTDLVSGAVTVTPSRQEPLKIQYQVKFGNAAFGTGSITVRVDPKTSTPPPPMTTPDVAVLHGQSSVVIDVLANDADPAGNLLVVQRATPDHPNQVRAAVIDGRYVRLEAVTASPLTPVVQEVTYTVSNGIAKDVTGSIAVTQVAAGPSSVVTLDDYATVRSGQSVAIPVLDNDVTTGGDPLTLVKVVNGAPKVGQLPVDPARGGGEAFVSGRLVRFVAPVVKEAETVSVAYEAQGESRSAPGNIRVTVRPPATKQDPNQDPVARPIEGRATAGQTIRIKVPTSGVDPDGDAVAVTGFASAPKQGRILSFNATSIEYQAYPFVGNGGTDTFDYVVTDTGNASDTGTIRVAVVPPGDPQPPVAVDDEVTAAPGSQVRVDVLANDIVAAGGTATISALGSGDTDGGTVPAKLASGRGPVEITAGPNDARTTVRYTITDGSQPASADVRVRSVKGYNLPPIAFDQYATPKAGATSVEVSLLKGAVDPDDTDGLRVVSPPGGNADGVVSLAVESTPRVVPFVIADAGNATATAVVYIPAAGGGAPMLRTGVPPVRLEVGKPRTIDVADYVVDPAGKPVITTLKSFFNASPAVGLSAAPSGKDGKRVLLRALGKYNGPAAATFQVTNGTSAGDQTGQEALISIPVQIGDPRPVLNCPSGINDIAEGGTPRKFEVATICHVWTPNPDDATALKFNATWTAKPAGAELKGQGTGVIVVDPARAAAGAKGTLRVSVGGASGQLAVRIVKADPPTVRPILVDGIKQGEARTIDIAKVATSSLRDPEFAVVGQPALVDGEGTARANGSTIEVTPGKDASGTVRFRFVLTDVSGPARTDRQVTGEITLRVLGRPDAPTGVRTTNVASETVTVQWTAPDDNGSSISKYVVTYNGGQKSCGTGLSCPITGLSNGQKYQFQVVAYNAVKASDPSSKTDPVIPDEIPGRIATFVGSNPQDRQLTLTWSRPEGKFSTLQFAYVLDWDNGGHKEIRDVATTRTVIDGLDNSKRYSFSISARNRQTSPSSPGRTTPATGELQSAGRPAAPADLTVDYAQDTSGSDTRYVQISWSAYDATTLQGKTPATFSVTNQTTGSVVCRAITSASCLDKPAVGKTYTYSVTTQNGAATSPSDRRHTSDPSVSTPFEVASTPDQITNLTMDPVQPADGDGTATIRYATVPSRGSQLAVNCAFTTDGSAPGTSSQQCPGSPWTYADPAGGQADQKALSVGNGATVRFVVWETNGSNTGSRSNTGELSAPTDAHQVNGPPGTVGGGSCTRSGSTLVVRWNAPANIGARTTRFKVRFDGGGYEDVGTGTGKDYGGRPESGQAHSIDVLSYDGVDEAGPVNISGPDCNDPPKPRKFVVSHSGSCSRVNSTCQLVYVRLIDFSPGAQATCQAAGAGGIANWGPVVVTTGADGNSAQINRDQKNRELFDTDGSRFPDGTYAIGADAGGITCN